jgi:fatty-acyl-CoA synthase
MGLPSYVHGTGSIPLLGETIGENLRRTVERQPDRDALIVCSQNVRMTCGLPLQRMARRRTR